MARNYRPASGKQPSTQALLASGVRYHQSGQLAEARSAYRKVLKQFPDQPDALHFLSRLYFQTGKFDDALKLLQRGIRIHDRHPLLHCMLGNIYRARGELPRAIKFYQQSLERDRDLIEALIGLGMAYRDSGQPERAVEVYQQALNIDPGIAETHNNLGNVYKLMGRLNDAISAYQKAVEINPLFAGGWHNLGSALLEVGNTDEALAALRQACKLAPSDQRFWQALASCLSQITVTGYDESLRADLLRCLDLDRIQGRGLNKTVSDYLNMKPLMMDDPLLVRFLQKQPVCDAHLEAWLITSRRMLLEKISAQDQSDIHREFLLALAEQCYMNEYLYEELAEETTLLDKLILNLSEQVNRDDLIDEFSIAIMACYRPLNRLAFCHSLTRPEELIRQQITERALETSIKDKLRVLTELDNKTSSKVRQQYEENPYPRWRFTDRPQATTLEDYLHMLFPDLNRSLRFPVKPAILSAGGGTGLQPIRTAMRFPDSQIRAIDLSQNSLAYATRKAREYNVSNITFAQADLLRLPELTSRYDFIECYGVLHHLAEPFAGWQALEEILNPGGVMRIALYSERARRPILKARDYVAEHGLPATPDGIRRFRKMIMSLPFDHPLYTLTASPDFYTVSECRDLVFHVCEHQYTLPEIRQTLEKLKLEFLGFEFPGFKTLREFKNQYPAQDSERNLNSWDKFEQENLQSFASQYVCWVFKPT